MGVFQVLAAIELISGRQCALLHFVEDNLYIHKLAAAHIYIHVCTQEFFRQYRNIKAIGIESGKVAAFNIIGYIACHFLERGAFCHIFVVNAMNGRSLFRYVHFGIDAHGFGFLVSVGIYFEITDFYYSVRVNVCTGGLQVKKDNRIFKIQFHEVSYLFIF